MSKYSNYSDIQILREIGKYDSRALEELYNRYSAILYTLIKKIAADDKTAENILVEVFSIIWRKIDKFDFKNGNAYVWLITLARNRAVDTIRRNRSSADEMGFYDDNYENKFIIPTLPKRMDDMDLETAIGLQPKIENVLTKLSEAQQYIIHLSYYEGYTLQEISQKLNLPIETVRNKVMVAMQTLRDLLISQNRSG